MDPENFIRFACALPETHLLRLCSALEALTLQQLHLEYPDPSTLRKKRNVTTGDIVAEQYRALNDPDSMSRDYHERKEVEMKIKAEAADIMRDENQEWKASLNIVAASHIAYILDDLNEAYKTLALYLLADRVASAGLLPEKLLAAKTMEESHANKATLAQTKEIFGKMEMLRDKEGCFPNDQLTDEITLAEKIFLQSYKLCKQDISSIAVFALNEYRRDLKLAYEETGISVSQAEAYVTNFITLIDSRKLGADTFRTM